MELTLAAIIIAFVAGMFFILALAATMGRMNGPDDQETEYL